MSNVRIGFSPTLTAGMYYSAGVVMNTFSLDIQMMTKSSNHINQNIALERAKYLVYEQFADSIILGKDDADQRQKFEDVGFRVIVLPSDVADQILCLAIYCKIKAVLEDQMDIIDISIRSTYGGGISYLHSEDESTGPFEEDGWWNQSTPECSKTNTSKKKVVTLDNPTWKSLDLEWSDGNEHEDIVIEVKLEKKNEKVDTSGENVVELRPNDKK
tara:strand:- start:334 stop:978 length:645 start_codon:yes stop_codon:yes gene_type:complete